MNDSKQATGEGFTSPSTTREPVVVQLAFWEGMAYISPLGTSVEDPDAWLRVESLDHAADRVGVEWTVQP